MRKTILLARPHPFIVNEMKPLLLQAGFDVKGVSSDSALTESRPSSYPAAVISAQHSPGIYIQQSDLAPGQAQASRDFLTAWI